VRGTFAKLVLGALCVAGCSHPRTELVIGLMTDLSATDMIDTVTLRAERSGVPVFTQTWLISGVVDEPEALPGSFGVFSADGSEPLVTLTATAYANKGTQPVVTRTTVTSLVHEQTLFLRMALVGGCTTMSCPAGATCVEGVCKAQAIDAHRFPVYRTNMEKNLACASGPKYRDTSTKQLMAVVGDCASNEDCVEGTCYKRLGAGTDLGGVVDMGPACDPVAQTGCPSGQKCYVSAGGGFVCKASGTKTLGQVCSAGVGDDCAAGLHCASDGTPAICRQYCNGDGDCKQAPSMSGSVAEPTNVPRCVESLSSSAVKLCSVSCDPIVANNDTGCATGRVCGFLTTTTDEYTDCLVSKGVADGAACTMLNDCAAGETCAQSGTGTPHCRPVCRPTEAGDCASPNQCPQLPGVSNPIFSACCPASGC
jgi:hypothetical protein